MSYQVPFVNARLQYSRLKPEIDAAISDCLTNGDLIYRRHLKDFEAELAAFVGVKYAIGVNSGYHALHFSLLAAGVGEGDEVITVAHTFVATVSAIVHCGATPVLVEVGPDHNMIPAEVERAITPRTKAILPVHLNGRMADMTAICALAKKKGLVVIEDAAQSLGATMDGVRAGSAGLTGCFSFYPFKILGGLGDGGAVTTNDERVAQMVSRLRYNGEDRETGEYHYHGYTALLDNVWAAVLSVKLRHLPSWIEHRRMIAGLYQQGLAGLAEIQLPPIADARYFDVFQNYVVTTPLRDALRDHLRQEGVETLVSWPKPMWEHAALKLPNPGLRETERICREVISLPMSAETTPQHVDAVVKSIKGFFAKTASPREHAASSR
jgi:dTDP-4-amino-4,6-dideoxygalactose transaminase